MLRKSSNLVGASLKIAALSLVGLSALGATQTAFQWPYGTPGTSAYTSYRSALPALAGNVIQVSVGGSHTLFLTSTKKVYASGNNNEGQLGTGGSTSFTEGPVQIHFLLNSGESIKQVSAGFNHSLAVTNQGRVFQWGKVYTAAGTTTYFTPKIVAFASGVTIDEVSAGGGHSLAVDLKTGNDSSLYGWGRNDKGQVGNNTTTDQALPVEIGSGNGAFQFQTVAAGYDFSLAVRGKTQGADISKLYSWGNDQYGQLGNGAGSANILAPTESGLPQAFALSAGYDHALVLEKDKNGQVLGVWSFGRNELGQCGRSSAITKVETPFKVKNSSTSVQASAGRKYSLLRDSNGAAEHSGFNFIRTAPSGSPVKSSEALFGFTTLHGYSGISYVAAGGAQIDLNSNNPIYPIYMNGNVGGSGNSIVIAASAAPIVKMMDAPSVLGGNTAQLTVTLDQVNSTGSAIEVGLTSSNPALGVPASVSVPNGQDSVTVSVPTEVVAADTRVAYEATMNNGARVVAGRTVVLTAPRLAQVTAQSATMPGAVNSQTITLKLAQSPENDLTLPLTISPTDSSAPVDVTFLAGQDTATVTYVPVAVQDDTRYTVSLGTTAAHSKGSFAVTAPRLSVASVGQLITPADTYDGFFLDSGMSRVLSIKLTSPAPQAGFVITIGELGADVTIPTGTIVVPGGTKAVDFTVEASTVSAPSSNVVTLVAHDSRFSFTVRIRP